MVVDLKTFCLTERKKSQFKDDLTDDEKTWQISLEKLYCFGPQLTVAHGTIEKFYLSGVF